MRKYICRIHAHACDNVCSYSIQNAGLGGMRHNTIMICWPDNWRRTQSWKLFIGKCSGHMMWAHAGSARHM